MSKVLLIDDDRKHSDLMQAYFKRFGINLVCAYDAEQGFKKLAREEPDLLLLDEPASGLDPRARIELMEILRELRLMGKTIFISSHILTELEELVDRVVIIHKGDDVGYVAKKDRDLFQMDTVVSRDRGRAGSVLPRSGRRCAWRSRTWSRTPVWPRRWVAPKRSRAAICPASKSGGSWLTSAPKAPI